jgi:high-affinity K+ transport system ATPase subunit B
MRDLIETALIYWLFIGVVLASLAEAYINSRSRRKRESYLNEMFLRQERLLRLKGE